MAAKKKGSVAAVDDTLPSRGPTTHDVVLYPRSAQALIDILEAAEFDFRLHPRYVAIDIDNLRNQLLAHIQRVSLGEAR